MTLKDVAEKAGCSVATASKALKNSTEISDEAKQRILAVAKDIGYLKKATAHKAVLGGIKTVIFNDIKSNSIAVFNELLPLAKKQGLVLIYTSVKENEAKELLSQLGAYGLIIKGGTKSKNQQRTLVIDDDVSGVYEFLKEISEYKAQRPSRAIDPSKPRPEVKIQKSEVKPQPKRDEEIWLL